MSNTPGESYQMVAEFDYKTRHPPHLPGRRHLGGEPNVRGISKNVVGGVSLPRMIIGCNWISGFSHKSAAGDTMIRCEHRAPESAAEIFQAFLENGIDAVLGLFEVDKNLRTAVDLAEEKTGKQMI